MRAVREQMDLSSWTFRQRKLLPSERNVLKPSKKAEIQPHSHLTRDSLSYVPLIAPSTKLNRIEFLASIADTFIYLVSKVPPSSDSVLLFLTAIQMGTTGSSEVVAMNTALSDIVARVKKYATVPIAVGFGVATRSHFDAVVKTGAEGVVVGSRIIRIIRQSPRDRYPQDVEAFCRELTKRGDNSPIRSASVNDTSKTDNQDGPKQVPSNLVTVLPPRFGQFGGQYVPEALVDCLLELEEAHKSAMADPAFLEEFRSYYGYINRPSGLYFAENLSRIAGGAKIWLKREDL